MKKLFAVPARGVIPALALLAFLLPGALLVTSELPAEEVGARSHPEIELSAARTFAWKPMPELGEDHPLAAGPVLDAKIRRAVETELEAAGLRHAGGAEPDLWIIYYINLDNRLQLAELDYHVGDWLGFQTELEDQHRRIRQYEQGTVVVDVIDAGTQELAWSGWVKTAAPSIGELRRKAEKKIEKTIHKMFREFPGS